MFWVRNEENRFPIRTLIWMPVNIPQMPNLRISTLKTCSLSTKINLSSSECKFVCRLPENKSEKINIVCLIQNFETELLWKVSLKILSSGIILKTFTHVYTVKPVLSSH